MNTKSVQALLELDVDLIFFCDLDAVTGYVVSPLIIQAYGPIIVIHQLFPGLTKSDLAKLSKVFITKIADAIDQEKCAPVITTCQSAEEVLFLVSAFNSQFPNDAVKVRCYSTFSLTTNIKK